METGLELEIARNDWKNAAITASNLSELYLTLGDVAAAVRVGEQSVELADRSGDLFQRIVCRTNLANALHQAARLQSSQLAFREAEVLQVEWQPQSPLLYSLRGFGYCDLLLDRGLLAQEVSSWANSSAQAADSGADGVERSSWLARCGEVRDRAETTLEWVKGRGSLYEGLDNLILGRAWLLEATIRAKDTIESSTEADLQALLQNTTHHLDESVSLLRRAGRQDHLPRGLLARAALWRVNSKFKISPADDLKVQNSKLNTENYLEKANRDLTEVEQIAGRSHMLIFQIEAALERCRLALSINDSAQARIKLDAAKALVKQTERPYEPHIPDWDEWDPPEYVGVFQPGEIVGYHRRNGEIAELEQAISTQME